VGLCGEKHNVLEVGVINVCINSEESLENHFYDSFKVTREGNTQGARENLFII